MPRPLGMHAKMKRRSIKYTALLLLYLVYMDTKHFSFCVHNIRYFSLCIPRSGILCSWKQCALYKQFQILQNSSEYKIYFHVFLRSYFIMHGGEVCSYLRADCGQQSFREITNLLQNVLNVYGYTTLVVQAG